jgi:hypothetical protein
MRSPNQQTSIKGTEPDGVLHIIPAHAQIHARQPCTNRCIHGLNIVCRDHQIDRIPMTTSSIVLEP